MGIPSNIPEGLVESGIKACERALFLPLIFWAVIVVVVVGVPHCCCYAKTMLSISVLCFYLLVHILVFSYDQRIRKTQQHAVVIIKKKKNPAHLLAKYAKGILHQCTWMQSCPGFLKLAILHDVNFIVI